MDNEKWCDLEISYWFGKRLGITIYKMSNGIYRIGIWKLYRLGNEWLMNWWKFIDIGREK